MNQQKDKKSQSSSVNGNKAEISAKSPSGKTNDREAGKSIGDQKSFRDSSLGQKTSSPSATSRK